MSDVFFCLEMPSAPLKNRAKKSEKYQNQQNAVCQIVYNFKLN